MNLTITAAAEKFMRRIVRFSGGSAQAGFRLKVSTGGCSGLASEFSVEDTPLAGDSQFDCNGLAVFLPAESRLLLDGVTIDFGETLAESGLTFRNPHAPASNCGSHGSGAPVVATVSLDALRRKG